MSKQKVRQSNFELLRIVAIFGIIYHHLLVKGASTCGYINSYNMLTDGCGGIIINSLIVGGKLFCLNYQMVWCEKFI